MPDVLRSLQDGPAVTALEVFIRLVVAALLGAVVAWTYRKTRDLTDASPTFPATLVLLAVLIAMVTQVIGDNVARAFSLVGALSIVRFRTVVRDTQDTAFVIYAVVVGMAVGANHTWVAVIGLVVVGIAAAVMRPRLDPASLVNPSDTFVLTIRLATAVDLDLVLGGLLDRDLERRQLRSIKTARQGIAIDVCYAARLKAGCSPDELVKSLNRIEGVQNVELTRDIPQED
jgi:uncharacterized membrane protein YhiD involved in acid resistance